MPRPDNMTEDMEFRTDIDTRGNILRRGRFVRRPRRINGRTVPGNARYYRRRQRELLEQRRRAGRGRGPRRSERRPAGADIESRTSAAGGAPSVRSGARSVTPRGGGGRRRRGGIRGALARVARGAANALARRRQRRR